MKLNPSLVAGAALGLLAGCSYMEDEDCFDKAQANDSLQSDVVRMACLNTSEQIRYRDGDCEPVDRSGNHLDFRFDFGDLDRNNPEDYRLVGEYSCGSLNDVNSGTNFYEVSSGGSSRIADSTFEAIGCYDDESIYADIYIVDYRSAAGECNNPVGHWNVTSFPNGDLEIREKDAGGWNLYNFYNN